MHLSLSGVPRAMTINAACFQPNEDAILHRSLVPDVQADDCTRNPLSAVTAVNAHSRDSILEN